MSTNCQNESRVEPERTHERALEPQAPNPGELPPLLREALDLLRTELVGELKSIFQMGLPDVNARLTKKLLDVEDVAQRLNVSVRLVESLIAEGELIPLRIRGTRRFTPESIDAYLRQCTGSKKKRIRRRKA